MLLLLLSEHSMQSRYTEHVQFNTIHLHTKQSPKTREQRVNHNTTVITINDTATSFLLYRRPIQSLRLQKTGAVANTPMLLKVAILQKYRLIVNSFKVGA
jgi:hypothetical protein